MTTEWYKKYRPRTLKDVVGQTAAVSVLQAFVDRMAVPHAILFSGVQSSGCGKTTMARILAKELKCSKVDLVEMNSAQYRGIESVRDITSRVGLHPMNGPTRVWILDECHQLSKDAQQGLLKLLEDTPSHVYFMLCTTEPKKLLDTIHTRCTDVKVKPLSVVDLEKLVTTVAGKESVTLTEDVRDKLLEVADGSARKALVLLQQVAGVKGEAAQLNALQSATVTAVGFDLAKLILYSDPKRVTFKEVGSVLTRLEEDPEGVRRYILSCATTTLLKAGKNAGWAAWVIECFMDDFFQSGKAGLALSCWQVFHKKCPY